MPRDKVLRAQRVHTTLTRQDGMPLGWKDLSFHPSALSDVEGAERGQVLTGQGSPATWQGLALGALGQALVAGSTDPAWTDVGLSAGVVVAPTIAPPEPADGSYVVGTGTYRLYKTATGLGEVASFTVAGGTFTPAENDPHYVTVSYNGGTPVVGHTTDLTSINGFSVIAIATVYRIGTVVDVLEHGLFGVALANRLNARQLRTGIQRESGLVLSEAATRLINISAGVVWYGASRIDVAAFQTGASGHALREWIWDGAIWTPTVVAAYENAYYQGASGKVAATGNKYLVLWVYRKLTAGNLIAGYILGTDEYATLAGAQGAARPTTPEMFDQFGVLVGRIIIQNGASAATQIDQAAAEVVPVAAAAQHNELLGLQGGTPGQYFHVTLAEHEKILQAAGPVLWTPEREEDDREPVIWMPGIVTLPPEGTMTPIPFDAGNFTASGSMTWTVEAGDVTTLAYRRLGRMIKVEFYLVTTTVGGTAAIFLRMAIPGGYVALRTAQTLITIIDNGTRATGEASVSASGTKIGFNRQDAANWSLSTNNTYVLGSFEFEVTR